MIGMRFYSDLFHGIGDSIRFLGIDYTPTVRLYLGSTLVKVDGLTGFADEAITFHDPR